MPLRTAPCPGCQSIVVFGEPQCRSCGQTFDYGPNPPPRPSAQEVEQAVLNAQLFASAQPVAQAPVQPQPPAQPAASGFSQAQQVGGQPAYTPPQQAYTPASGPSPAAPAASSEPMMEGLDTGRASAVGDVQTEAPEGFIDSSLFARYTPATVQVDLIEGLESASAAAETLAAAPGGSMLDELDTGRADAVGEVQTVAVEGFIDSTLFARYTPDTVQTEAVPDLERSPSGGRVFTSESGGAGEGEHVTCSDCGTPNEGRSRCRSCGAPLPSHD